MITRCRLLLVSSEAGKDKLAKYEAIVPISSLEEVEEVWGWNKTPVISEQILDDAGRYYFLYVPENIIETIDKEPGVFINYCHDHGFECGEYNSGEVFDTNDDDCFLCRIGNLEGSNRPLWVYNKNVKREADIIIYNSEHFFVVAEYGALIRGFLMICPKEHVLSMANLKDEYFEEYFQVEKDVEMILKNTYGSDKPVSFFEHGSDPSGKSSHKRSVVHAHTHVAYGWEMKEKHMKMVQMKETTLQELRGGKYFSYRKNADGKFMAVNDPNVFIQRQYPRQIIAEEIGLAPGQYNWRTQGFEENVKATYYYLHRYLSENLKELPERVQKACKDFVKAYAMREDYRKN